jgi:hypothetical protein
MLQVFHLNVAYDWNGYTRVFKFFFLVFASVMLQVSQLFRMYVASVSSGCCKTRSGVTHVVMRPTYHSHLLLLLGCHRVGA